MNGEKILFVFISLFFVLSCSLRDYTNHPVIKDAYDGPMIFLLQPVNGLLYPGKIRVVADVSETAGLDTVEVFYDGQMQRFFVFNAPSYRLDTEVSFSSGGWKTIEIRAKNKIGIQRSVSVSLTVEGPFIRITNHFAKEGHIYTAGSTIILGGEARPGRTNLSRVFVRVKRLTNEEDITASLIGYYWNATISLNPNEDVVLTAIAEDMSGVSMVTPSVTVYQDQKGPHLVLLTRPISNATEAAVVVFEGHAQDDKVGAWRFVGTTDGWSTTFTEEFSSWWGNRDIVEFGFIRAFTPGNYTLSYYVEDFLGNRSKTNSLTFNVDGNLPYVYFMGPMSAFCTNQEVFPVYGEYGNALVLQYSLNGGAWQLISTMGGGLWTNTFTFTPNQENTLRLRAISNQYTNVSLLYRFLIDTIPPQVTLYDVGNQPRVNTSIQPRHIRIEDNLSGVMLFYDILEGYWGYGGMGFLAETNLKTWLGNWYEDSGSRDFPFGAVITNKLILIDRAGNTNTSFSRVAEVYPAIFVTPGGSIPSFGIASAPQKLLEGMNKAKNLGVRSLVLQEGTYNPSGVLKPQNNMMVIGGFDPTFTNQGGYSILQNSGNRIMELDNVFSVFLSKLDFNASGSPSIDGVLWIRGGSVYLLNTVFSANQGKRGSAIYAENAQVGVVSNRFINNETQEYGVFFGAGSLYFGIGNEYLSNKTHALSNLDAQILLVGGAAVISNEIFSSYMNTGTQNKILIHVYARDMGTFFLHNSTFSSIVSSTNAIHLWLAGNMQNTSILSNIFFEGNKYIMVKDGGWGGYQLAGNTVYTNSSLALWVECLPTHTNYIFPGEIIKFNDPSVTRATPDSTNNRALP